MTEEKKKELLESANKTLRKMAERRAKVQNDVKYIVETISEPFAERERYNRKLRKRGLYY